MSFYYQFTNRDHDKHQNNHPYPPVNPKCLKSVALALDTCLAAPNSSQYCVPFRQFIYALKKEKERPIHFTKEAYAKEAPRWIMHLTRDMELSNIACYGDDENSYPPGLPSCKNFFMQRMATDLESHWMSHQKP